MRGRTFASLAAGAALILAGCGSPSVGGSGIRTLERDEQIGPWVFRSGTRVEMKGGRLVRADLRQPHAIGDLLVTGGLLLSGGAVTEAVLAADQPIGGIWCKGGSAVILDARTQQLRGCTLARPRALLEADWPAGTIVSGLNGEAGASILFELPSGAAPVDVDGVAVPPGFRIALDSRTAQLRSLEPTLAGGRPFVEVGGERLTGRIVFEPGAARGTKWGARGGRAEAITVRR